MTAPRLRTRPPAAIAALAGFFCVAACGGGGKAGGPAAPGRGKVSEKVVLEVEGATFRNSDFDRYLADNAGKAELAPAPLSRLFDRFIEERLLLAAARRQGVSLTPEERREYLARLAEEVPPDEARPEAPADERLFDRPLLEKYTRRFLGGIEVSDDEVRAYYEGHKKEFLAPERVRVSQILLETETRAVEVLRTLDSASEEAFRRTAREASVGPEAFKGGAMGVFKAGDLPYEMEKVVFALEEGRLSPVVESSYGFHIFRVDRKFPPELLSEAEAAPAIRLKVLAAKAERAVAAHLEELKRTLAWTAHPDRLAFAYQRNDA
jgi:hypothetical protein